MAAITNLIPALILALLASAAVKPNALSAQTSSFDDRTSYAGLEDSLRQLSPGDREELLEFVAGNTLFVIYHEGGHMLVSELELPVLAQEEDAVDNLATISMLAADTDDMDLYLYHAMAGWFLMSEDNYEALVFYDTHDLNEQRGYRMLCMMVGADEDAFLDLAEDLGLPDDRIESCAFDYEQASDAWEIVTDPFLREEDTPAGKIRIVYDDIPAELNLLAVFLKEQELLELVADELDTYYDLPEDVTFRAAECRTDNAFWDPNIREVTICYELLGGFAELYLDLLNADR